MKENETPLYATPELSRKVTEYSEQHSTPLPKYITDFHTSIAANRDDSYFMSSNFQSQWNYVLARSIGAKRGERMSASVTLYRIRQNAHHGMLQSWKSASMLATPPWYGLMLSGRKDASRA